MPANKNALIRYKTIDNCLRNTHRRWTLDDLVDACCEALLDMEGTSCSVRTVQGDIQMMRSDKLGYNAPIEVYDHKYYRYADPRYSITDMPLSQNDYDVMKEAVDMLRQFEDFDHFQEMSDVLSRLQEKLAIVKGGRKPIVNFDSMPDLKGLKHLNPLYNYIARKQTLRIMYRSFKARSPKEFILFPYLLKEFRNRWFVFGSVVKTLTLYNLALDRIISIEPVDEPYKENPRFDTEHFFDDVIGVSKNIGDTSRSVKFVATREQSQYILTKPVHSSQRVIAIDEKTGEHTFKIKVVPNFELVSVLLSYGAGIKVISPKSVVKQMTEEVKKMADSYKKQHSGKKSPSFT